MAVVPFSIEDPSKKVPCDRHGAIAAIHQFIRTMATTAEGGAAVLDEWKEKPWDVASKILDKWEAVRVEAAKHASLLRCSTDTRPTGMTLKPLLALEDGTLVERILHEIVGIPVDIVRHMRALHAKKVQVQSAAAKARRRTVSKTECGVGAAAAAISSLRCVARCASCEPGCGCKEWDKTNHSKVDGGIVCYACYLQLCAQQAEPTSVEHIADGEPIVISTVATGLLDTDDARSLCDDMMAAMRRLAHRRAYRTQHGVQGDRFQLRRPRASMYRKWSPAEKKKYFSSNYKHLLPAPAGESDTVDVYNEFVEASHAFAFLREGTLRNGLRTLFGDDICETNTPVDSVGGENLLAFKDAREQAVHGDLPPAGTAQAVTHLTDAQHTTTLLRFRGGAPAACAFLRRLRGSDERNQMVLQREFDRHLYSFWELGALAAAAGRLEACNIIKVPAYPGPVRRGHTNMMLASAMHCGPGVAEVERGLFVDTVYLGARPDLESDENADTAPLQIAAVVMLAMLGLMNVIFHSATMQKELWSPFMLNLTADEKTAPGNLSPSEWTKLRNNAFRPAEPEPVAEEPASTRTHARRAAKRAQAVPTGADAGNAASSKRQTDGRAWQGAGGSEPMAPSAAIAEAMADAFERETIAAAEGAELFAFR